MAVFSSGLSSAVKISNSLRMITLFFLISFPFFPKVGQSFIPSSVPATFAPSPTPAVVSSGLNDLFELSTGIGMAPGGYVAPKAVST